VYQIESGLLRRQGRAVTNFEQAQPLPQSDLAQQITKDPYNFDFLLLGSEAHERDASARRSFCFETTRSGKCRFSASPLRAKPHDTFGTSR
jgi:hypothetical protein